MNIVFVTYHTCARANKMAKALATSGHNVVVLQHLAASNTILYEQPLSSFYKGEEDLEEKIMMFNDWADIFHIHNEPDWPVVVTAKNAEVHIPIIYDCHDLNSQRNGQADQMESAAFMMADAAIFPSIAYLYGATEYHNIDRSKMPLELVYSMCLKDDRPRQSLPQIHALVYEGHHIAPIHGTDFNRNHPLYYGYRDYLAFAGECSLRQLPTVFYGTKPDFEAAYRDVGALTNPMLAFPRLMSELTRYSWGFVGHPEDHPQWQKAMPNKLFEYLTAGLPIIAWNCEEIEAWIQGYDIGIVVNSYNELEEVFWDDLLRENLAKNVQGLIDAGHLDMEIQVPKIIKLYERVIKTKGEPWDESKCANDQVQSRDSGSIQTH